MSVAVNVAVSPFGMERVVLSAASVKLFATGWYASKEAMSIEPVLLLSIPMLKNVGLLVSVHAISSLSASLFPLVS